MKTVKVLGTGCKKCNQVFELIEQTIKAQELEVDLTKVTDLATIMQYKIVSTPAVVVDDQVVLAGAIPTIDQITGWLIQPN